ncbi:DUF6344 domain-containing protein [Streptomyces sp. TG1A-8]|uniref:DUF6344 domain-containing protein n=1 Tax=Streptomyces sp. TG1A-8 TaxID=3051385 RepID=UPI00265C6B51|nr:DUF6344 domain-containing protein [Streptomyces sp. TG1A-8]MDO0926841.1 DUF6344 domain-containing protein [Streptomyces sp. TG1A-8]
MTQNKVMKLWTAIVTAFLALCTALGLVTPATAAAAPRSESPSTGTAHRTNPTIPAPRHRTWTRTRALPPTMKQRIRAEAHGKSPRCRHRALTGAGTEQETLGAQDAPAVRTGATTGTQAHTPQQRPTARLDC